MNKKELFQKLYTVLVLLVIVALVSLVAPREKMGIQKKDVPFSVVGSLACLEPVFGYASGCVPGVISDDGARYVLDTTNAVVKDESIDQNTRVLITGEFTPISDSETAASFGVSGIVIVSAIDRAD